MNFITEKESQIITDLLELKSTRKIKKPQLAKFKFKIMNTVFKIQRSVFSSHAKDQVLIYDKSQSIHGQFDITKDVKNIMGKKLKIFVHGSFKNGIININKIAKHQNW